MPAEGKSTLRYVPPVLENAKLAWVVSLRQAFQSSITDMALRYNEDNNTSKILISRSFKRRFEKYPSILVSSAGGDMSFTYLSDDFVYSKPEDSKQAYAGRVIMTISLTMTAKSSLERERILDHLIIFIRHLFVGVLREYGQTVTRDIRVGPENQIEVENEPVFEQVIDIPVYLEYQAEIDQSSFEYIRKIDLSIDAVDSIDVDNY